MAAQVRTAAAHARTSREERDQALDRALKDTFPASDPPSLIQPSAEHDVARTAEPAALPLKERNVVHFAIHPIVYLHDREPVRSIDEAVEAIRSHVAGRVDQPSEQVLRRLLDASTSPQAEAAGAAFRA